jgi:hypothetical protein
MRAIAGVVVEDLSLELRAVLPFLERAKMQKGTKYALLLASIPFITLVFMLPLANRVEPVILGLPFLLFWILVWVFLTPFILLLAYLMERRFNSREEGQ